MKDVLVYIGRRYVSQEHEWWGPSFADLVTDLDNMLKTEQVKIRSMKRYFVRNGVSESSPNGIQNPDEPADDSRWHIMLCHGVSPTEVLVTYGRDYVIADKDIDAYITDLEESNERLHADVNRWRTRADVHERLLYQADWRERIIQRLSRTRLFDRVLDGERLYGNVA